MHYYHRLIELGCFRRKDVVALTGSIANAKNLLFRYQKKGLIEQIRRDYYCTIDKETDTPYLSRYEIGSALFSDSCISYHSAFELFGLENQISYDCYLTGNIKFRSFEFNGTTYKHIASTIPKDFIVINNIRVTSIEQTIIDCIKDLDKIIGLEELIRCLELVSSINEEKLLSLLKIQNNGFLYQKCGYILQELKEDLHLSTSFIEECRKHISKAKKYLSKDIFDNSYHSQWRLYAPKNLKSIVNKGVNLDAIG